MGYIGPQPPCNQCGSENHAFHRDCPECGGYATEKAGCACGLVPTGAGYPQCLVLMKNGKRCQRYVSRRPCWMHTREYEEQEGMPR